MHCQVPGQKLSAYGFRISNNSGFAGRNVCSPGPEPRAERGGQRAEPHSARRRSEPRPAGRYGVAQDEPSGEILGTDPLPASPESRLAGRHGRWHCQGSTFQGPKSQSPLHGTSGFDAAFRHHVVPQGGTRVVSSSADPGFRLRLILGYFMTSRRAGLVSGQHCATRPGSVLCQRCLAGRDSGSGPSPVISAKLSGRLRRTTEARMRFSFRISSRR